MFDVYLTGELAAELTREQAGERLAQIFKTNPATMLGLLTGKPQILKRGVDKDTALKYREALQRAGVAVAFKAQVVTAPIASAQPTVAAHSAATATATELSLAPVGADVLSTAERPHTDAPIFDLSYLSVAAPGPLTDVSQHRPTPPVPSLDHLSLAATGSDLLDAAERLQIPVAIPDTSELSLAPVGTKLETLHTKQSPVQVDISQLSLAPSGAELLTPEQRHKANATAPNTDHIKLA